MAEERLIDTDKDKKYKIRKNKDGEDELYIDESQDEQVEEVEEVMFEVPECDEDDEDDTLLTPEQLALKRERIEREKAERDEEVNALISSAKADCEQGKYATALDYLAKAVEFDDKNGEAYALRIAIFTCNFTDYSQIVTASEYADEVDEYTSEETKKSMFAVAKEGLEQNIAKLKEQEKGLDEENEKQKAHRAKKFVRDRNIALICFALAMAVFAGFCACAIVFATRIYSVQTNEYVVKTIVFAAISLVVLAAALVALRKVLITGRRVRLNKRNTATKLGRELIVVRTQLNAFTAVYSALKGEK